MNKNSIFAAAIIAACTFSSCKDDIVKEKRLVGEWQVDEYIVNSASVVPSWDMQTLSVKFAFDSDGDFQEKLTYQHQGTTYELNFIGTWLDADGDLQLDFDQANSQGAEFFYGSPSNYLVGNDYMYQEVFDIIELKKGKIEMTTTINDVSVTIKATQL